MTLPRLRRNKKTAGWGRWFCAPILSYYPNGGFEKSEPPFLCACRPMTTCRDTVADWRLFFRVLLFISQYPWSAPIKKSVAPPSEQSGFEHEIKQYITDNTFSCACAALCRTGAFCFPDFETKCPEVRCRSPPLLHFVSDQPRTNWNGGFYDDYYQSERSLLLVHAG